jgi:hypothetical protein
MRHKLMLLALGSALKTYTGARLHKRQTYRKEQTPKKDGN